jgi:hypothetical protein
MKFVITETNNGWVLEVIKSADEQLEHERELESYVIEYESIDDGVLAQNRGFVRLVEMLHQYSSIQGFSKHDNHKLVIEVIERKEGE